MDDIEQAMREATSLYRAGRLAEAEGAFRRVLQEDPDRAEALQLLGVVCHATGRRDAAVEYLSRSVALRPTAATWQHNLAEAWLAGGDVDRAIAAYRAAIALDPSKAVTRAGLGVALSRRGSWDEAIEQLEKSLALGLKEPDVYLRYARALLARGHVERAIEACRTSVGLREGSAAGWQALGEALHRAGRLEDAGEAFGRAIRINPNFERPHHGLAVVLAERGKGEEAIASFETALRIRPDYPEAHHGLAVIYHKMGKLDLAAGHYKAAIARLPDSLDARFEYAALLETQGNVAAALEQWRVLRGHFPDREDLGFHISALEQELAEGSMPAAAALAQAPRSWVEGYFDGFASNFDRHLTGKLNYRGPALLLEAVRELNPSATPLDVLDLGCGTGLVGAAFKPMARRLVGIDVSAAMLERARERGIYDELILDDLAGGMHRLAEGSSSGGFDLVLAADVFIYIGDLGAVFSGVEQVLRTGGMMGFVTEAVETDHPVAAAADWRLLMTRRYAHSRRYLERMCGGIGLEVLVARRVEARLEKNKPVGFWLMVGKKG